jgi:hypothetical protein
MGNTQAKSQQFSTVYADNSITDSFRTTYTPIIDRHSGEITALRNDLTGEISSRQSLSNSLDAFITSTNGKITALNDKITGEIAIAVKGLQTSIDGIKSGLTAYITVDNLTKTLNSYATTESLVAVQKDLTGQITSASSLNSIELQKIRDELNKQGINISDKITELSTRIENEQTRINFSINNLQSQITELQNTHRDMPYNTVFQQFGVGNGWFLQPQMIGDKDNLCIGKDNIVLTCITSTGDINYDPSNSTIQRSSITPPVQSFRVRTNNINMNYY